MIPTSLSENIIYKAAALSKSFQDRMQTLFKEAGYHITSEQFTLLTILWYQDGLSQNEIAQIAHRDKTTISRVIGIMKQRGLVTALSKHEDQRYNMIKLTAYGREVQNQLVRISGELFLHTISGVKEQKLRAALNVLQQLHQKLL